jgi:5-methylcytosine-specific restriction endonuclease McrA
MSKRLMTPKAIAGRERRAARGIMRACAHDGVVFVASRPDALYCSLRCKDQVRRARSPERLCLTCGSPFPSRHDKRHLYCSLSCAAKAHITTNLARAREATQARMAMLGSTAGRARANRRAAEAASRCERKLADVAARTRACEICGAMFVSTRQDRARFWGRCCSKSCAAQASALRHAAVTEASLGHGSRTCARCQVSFDHFMPHARFCSRDCSDAWHRGRGTERVRRCGKDRVRRLRPQVLERDGYVCGICRLPIRRDVDVQHPLALTIDHIMPLAAGGSDRLDNLQPAHRQCNVDKGDDLPMWWARQVAPATVHVGAR